VRHRKISWTLRCEDGVKREVRAEVSAHGIKWQFKRKDEERWDYDSLPTADDWDELMAILKRRMGRGRAMDILAKVEKMRRDAHG
jgi:hypothetical protein